MSIIINNKSNFFENNLSESPIEKIFLAEIIKYLENGTEIFEQKTFETKIGNFRVDFLIKNGHTEYIIELDGKDYHKLRKDLWRDSFLLGESKVNSIIRIKGSDVVFNLNECLYFLSKIFPNTFSERGKSNLTTLVGFENKKSIDDAIEKKEFKSVDKYYLHKVEFGDENSFPYIEIDFKNQDDFKFWSKLYDFAENCKIYNIDELNDKFIEDYGLKRK